MDNSTNSNSITKTIISLIVFLGVVAGAIAMAVSGKKNAEEPMTPTDSNATGTPATDATSTPLIGTSTDATASGTLATSSDTTSHKYKDGTYAASGTYRSPAGIEHVNVSVTIKNDIITDTTFKGLAENSRSIDFQEKFASGYRTLVIGENINDIKLGKVSGSSLTPSGFNDAIGKIQDEALI